MNMLQSNISTEQDGLETAILLALFARNKGRVRTKIQGNKNRGMSKLVSDMEIFCPRKPEFPKDMISFDLSDNERLYSASMDDLVVSPEKAIGRRLEVAMLCDDGTMKWTLIKAMPTPRGLVAMTNRPVSWFCWHYRTVKEGKPDTYIKRPLAISDGKPQLLNPMGWKGFDARQDREETEQQLALMLSVFEDTHRSGAVLATVEEAARLTFPVGESAYKSFFALRDGLRDTPTGRRNPILHWCREHMRRVPSGETSVSGHEKGKTEIVHGRMRLSLCRSEGYGAIMEQNGPRT